MTKYRNSRIEAENQELEQVEQEEQLMTEPAKTVEEETWKKRYGDQRRYLDQIKNEKQSEIDDLKRKYDMAVRGQIKPPKSDEDVENWIKEYPDFAGILDTIVKKKAREETSTLTQKLQEIEVREQENAVKEAFLQLQEKHSDLKVLLQSDDLHTWLQGQPKKDREAIYESLDVDAADFVLRRYKDQLKRPKNSKEDDDGFDYRGAAKVARKTGIVDEPVGDFGDFEFSESQIEKLSKQDRNWFSKNEDKIMSAMQRGKIFMDISGGAR